MLLTYKIYFLENAENKKQFLTMLLIYKKQFLAMTFIQKTISCNATYIQKSTSKEYAVRLESISFL